MKLCLTCGTVAKPRIATRAWWMFGLSAAGTATLIALSAATAAMHQPVTPSNEEHPVLWLLFLAACFHPRVCPACGSLRVVPTDSPIAQRVLPPG